MPLLELMGLNWHRPKPYDPTYAEAATLTGRVKPLYSQIRAVISSRENIAAAFFAAAITFALTDPGLLSTIFFYYAISLWAGYMWCGIRPRWNFTVFLIGIIALSALVAIPVSFIATDRLPAATAFLALMTIVLLPLVFIQVPLEKIFYALIPCWFIQTGSMTWQWFTGSSDRVSGLAYNANAASSFLLLGVIFLLHKPKLRWMAVPLLMAIPFSGSRWVVVVGVMILGLMFIAKHVPWRWVLVGLLVSFGLLLAGQHSEIQAAYRVGQTSKEAIDRTAHDAEWRLTPSTALFTPSILIPQGFVDSQLHDVPIRMSVETGLLSGLAWLAVIGVLLYRRPRFGWAWWCMAAVGLLSVMYYFTWIGALGAFWWLLAGELMRKPSKTVEAPL